MKRLVLFIVGATICAAALVVATVRPAAQPIPRAPQPPAHVAAFADAQCRRDPAGLVAHAADLSPGQATSAMNAADACSVVRYLGSSHDAQAGVLYFFVLTNANDEYEMWWVYTVNDAGLVTGLR